MDHAGRRQAEAARMAHHLLVTSEMSALRNNLNPHFLFNMLQSIIALMRHSPAAAEAALLQCSDMLRYVLRTEKNGVALVALDDELPFVRNDLDLESLRLGPPLTVGDNGPAGQGGPEVHRLSHWLRGRASAVATRIPAR